MIIYYGRFEKDFGMKKYITCLSGEMKKNVLTGPIEDFFEYFEFIKTIKAGLQLRGLKVGTSQPVLMMGFGSSKRQPKLVLEKCAMAGMSLEESEVAVKQFFTLVDRSKFRNWPMSHLYIDHGQRTKTSWSAGEDFEDIREFDSWEEAVRMTYDLELHKSAYRGYENSKKLFGDDAREDVCAHLSLSKGKVVVHTMISLDYAAFGKLDPRSISAHWDQVIFYNTEEALLAA